MDKLGLSLRKLISEHHDPQTKSRGQESLDTGAPPVPVSMDLTQENTRAGSSGPRPTYSLAFRRKEFFSFPDCTFITFCPCIFIIQVTYLIFLKLTNRYLTALFHT